MEVIKVIDGEQHKIGLGNGCLNLATYLVVEDTSFWHPSTRIDDSEVSAKPLCLALESIASDSRLILHNRNLLTHEAIEQGALADVWSTDDDDGG